ncbi:hypothetical protein SH501x_005337 [Pirellulaceae bacterium SH501]
MLSNIQNLDNSIAIQRASHSKGRLASHDYRLRQGMMDCQLREFTCP